MRPAAGELLHFSEDPTITRFVPHVAATATIRTPYVWAVDSALAPGYWFPEFWDAVVGSSLDFSGIRLRNAQPRSTP